MNAFGLKLDRKPVLGGAVMFGTPKPEALSIDYRYLFNPIEDQGQFGTCVAFAFGATYEAYYLKRKKERIKVSKAALYSMTKNYFEPSTIMDGGLYPDDAASVFEKYGYVLEESWPYPIDPAQANLLTEPIPDDLYHAELLDHNWYTVGIGESVTAQDIVNALHANGPVLIGTSWPNAWSYPAANGAVDPNPSPNDVAGGHELVVVGCDAETQMFTVRNSWGDGWNPVMGGYFHMPYSGASRVQSAITLVVP